MFAILSALLLSLWNEYARTKVQAGIPAQSGIHHKRGRKSRPHYYEYCSSHQKNALHAYLMHGPSSTTTTNTGTSVVIPLQILAVWVPTNTGKV